MLAVFLHFQQAGIPLQEASSNGAVRDGGWWRCRFSGKHLSNHTFGEMGSVTVGYAISSRINCTHHHERQIQREFNDLLGLAVRQNRDIICGGF